ncbi:MAG: hypothetical protein HYY40_04950 [Bacteroidetes bacterium]|nr:hypothetical protein [Bacteroidota bacterium]
MKTNSLFNILVTLTVAFISLNSGCRPNEDKDTQAANDNAQAEFVSDDIEYLSEYVISGVASMKTGNPLTAMNPLAICAIIERDTLISSDPDTVTIDFGTSNTLCDDNRTRRGIIMVVYSGDKWTTGSFRTITFTNFFVNDFGVEGIHTVAAKGQNGSGNYNWDINAENMKVTNPEGNFHSWNSTRNREMIDGAATSVRTDDIFLITGSASGTTVAEKDYTATIMNALRREMDCKWFVSGTVVIKPQGKRERTLDFGDGKCDDQATVSIRKQVYKITLK